MCFPKSFKVGVAIYKNLELADAACIDMIAAFDREFLQNLSSFTGADDSLVQNAPEVSIDWIHSDTEVIPATAGLQLKPTATYTTAPKDYDVLLVPGLSLRGHPEGSEEFLKEAVKHSKVVMTTCGGSMWLADLGLLDGKDATTNAQALAHMRQTAKKVNWQDKNWVVDGKFWSSGAAGFGYGMMAEFCRKTFPADIAERQLEGLGFAGLNYSQETEVKL